MEKTSRRKFLIGSTVLATTAAIGAHIARGNAIARSLDETKNKLRKLVPESMTRNHVPGLSLALARNGEIVWAEAFGLADKEANASLNPATVFEAASLSKPAYSYAVLKLVEQGKFSLDEPLLDYFGRDLNPAEPRFKQITAKHVLSHTSGIEPVPGESRPPKLNFAPGERFEYSPHGFDILQLAVQAAVGETIVPMMERMVLKPFGMTRSGWGWSPDFAASSRARGYNDKGELKKTFDERVWALSPEQRAKALAPYQFESVPNAAAGLHATPSDYARFMIEVMRPGANEAHLSLAMQTQMLTAHTRMDKAKFDALAWGLGFGLQHPNTPARSFWHWGDWGIFQHYAVAYPADGTVLVIMTNSPGLTSCRDLAQPTLGRDQPAFDWLFN